MRFADDWKKVKQLYMKWEGKIKIFSEGYVLQPQHHKNKVQPSKVGVSLVRVTVLPLFTLFLIPQQNAAFTMLAVKVFLITKSGIVISEANCKLTLENASCPIQMTKDKINTRYTILD
ncbi:unnamed protein product [Timema podura]|uniref:Uncharacterized protein n=1 Tax=Timema podura TaxID=61482 RepID=A0ABN7NNF2_TIMPD|nr:unnamed protein product [Timema podura]